MSVNKVNKTTGEVSRIAGLVNSEKVNTMYGAFPSDASASNKLVSDSTANEKISDAIADKADKVSSATNGNFAGLDASGNLTDSGKKPSDFQTALTFDNAPTENSNNPVKSNGIYVANRNIYEVMGQNGAKNLLDSSICAIFAPNYVGNKVASANGLTFTWNDDGTLIVDGTPTDSSVNVIVRLDFTNDSKSNTDISKLAGKKIIASLGHEQIGTESLQIKPGYFDSNGSSYQISSDIGVYGEYTYGLDAKYARTYIVLRGNTSYDNIKLSPMIRLASDIDNTYQPYAKTNRDLTVDVQPIPTMINDLGAKNVMPFILSDIKTYNNGGTWNGNSYTQNGVTFTLDLDEKGSLIDIVVNGTATAKCFFTLTNWADKTGFIGKILNGCTEGSPTTFSIIITYRDSNNQYITDKYQVDNDRVVEDVSGSAILKFMIMVMSGVTISNKKFYPMLRYASISDDTYVPYAKTNQQLTEDTTALLDNTEVNGAVNMLPYPYSDSNKVDHGVTFTDNGDGTVSVNGTASQDTVAAFYFTQPKSSYLPAGTYRLTVEGRVGPGAGVDWYYIYNQTKGQDLASPSRPIFTYNGTDTLFFRYTVGKGQTISTTLKPMITVVSYNGDYVPYAKSNQELTKETTGLLDNVNKNGCKNLLKNYLTDIVQTDGTVTVSDTGVITVNGTVNLTEQNCVIHNKSIVAGDYILSDGSNNDINDNHYHRIYYRVGSGSATRLIGNAKITVSSSTILKLWIYIDPTTHGSYSNEKYYPMLRLASNPDDTYVPYAKSNMELTEKVDDLNGKYILSGQRFIEVEQESGDTYAALFGKLLAAINTSIASLGTNERLEVIGLEGAFAGKNLATYMYNNTNVVNALSFIGSAFTDNWQSSQFYTIYMSSTLASNHFLISTLKSTPTFAYEMASATVPDGYKFALRCHVYKRLVTT